MGYNRRNLLLKIIDVQNEYNQHKQEGVATVFIFRRYIKDKFRISYGTFHTYLGTPAVRELKALEDVLSGKVTAAAPPPNPNQLDLFG